MRLHYILLLNTLIYGFNLTIQDGLYLHFKGVFEGKIHLGNLEYNTSSANIIQVTRIQDEDDEKYNKEFIDNCLKAHFSNNMYPCPNNNNGVCLFWRANRKCIGMIKRSVLMKYLMKFCDTFVDNPDCGWYYPPRDWKSADSLTKWLEKDKLNDLC